MRSGSSGFGPFDHTLFALDTLVLTCYDTLQALVTGGMDSASTEVILVVKFVHALRWETGWTPETEPKAHAAHQINGVISIGTDLPAI